jgi:hypothetical protein
VVTFQVGSSSLTDFQLDHLENGCSRPMLSSESYLIAGDTAVMEGVFEDGGRFAGEVVFTSESTAAGTYSFRGLKNIGAKCPREGTGAFTVVKVR